MAKHPSRSQGFILIAALLLLFLLSGIAVGVMMLTNSEMRIGGNDKESNMAYYGAEAGMEKLTADLAALYQLKQAPTDTDIQQLVAPSNNPDSTMVGSMAYNEFITYPDGVKANGTLISSTQHISSGANQGLTAFITHMDLQVLASRPSTAAANMTRRVEIAEIPVFQFGVFSDSDLSYFPGPIFAFAGRVHTNGNLFPTPGNLLVFGSKITVVGEIVRDFLANGFPVGSSYNGAVFAPNADLGCDGPISRNPVTPPSGAETSTCISFDRQSESWTNPVGPGLPPGGFSSGPLHNTNYDWLNTTAPTTFKHNVVNGRSDGVKKLILPFVQPGVGQIEIIRKPALGELSSSPVSSSRLYNQANIHVLLADNEADLRPNMPLDSANNVNLAAATTAILGGDAIATGSFAADTNQLAPLPALLAAAKQPFPLITGWIRVEYLDAAGNWNPVTNQWLALGIGRDVTPPTAPGTGIHPTAILRLQELADRTTLGVADAPGSLGTGTNWFPINFYDAREGQVRDPAVPTGLCGINGIMNAVEIDTGNLKAWLKTNTGKLVFTSDLNGYLLYFSDRRGMLKNTYLVPPAVTGEYGFEDVVNTASSTTGTPDGLLDVGEDVNNNSQVDTWGAANVLDGFRFNATVPANPYVPVNCLTTGRKNRVTGARHVLRLIDGSLGNLPLPIGSDGTNGGGFTVASENPVYVLGDYNAGNGQGFSDTNHAAAAILADAVTLLSNPISYASAAGGTAGWNDEWDMAKPDTAGSRKANPSFYRVAIAGGKNLTFQNPGAANSRDWGTDGGVHNFLRYLENWGGIDLNYTGSLVSLYYSQYNTGTFKCCNTVYGAPNRKYVFDQLFLLPSNLPPGTPRFTDVVNLSYRQDFTPY